MASKQKPLSFSLHPLNHAYIESVVSKQKEANHRYNRSMYMDDLITHLRTKAEAKPKTQIAVVQEATKEAVKKLTKFKPPTFAEVDLYMIERGVSDQSEAASFGDFYESNGWKVGKNKMKCWKASVRNWLKGYKKSTSSAAKEIEHVEALDDTSWANNLDDVL